MARLNGPLFSLDARGKLGRALIYSIWKGLNRAEARRNEKKNTAMVASLMLGTVFVRSPARPPELPRRPYLWFSPQPAC